MSKQKSEFVSALGTSFEIVKALAEQTYAIGGDDNHLRAILKDSELVQDLALRLVMGTPYIVDVNKAWVKELFDLCDYSYMPPEINDYNFSVEKIGPVAIQLVEFFVKRMNKEEILESLDKMGLRPATMAELLALGAQYPELQKQFWIVALGDIIHNNKGVACAGCLDNNTMSRGLRLARLKDVCSVMCYRFATVAK